MILHIMSPGLDKFTLPFIKLMDDYKNQMFGQHKYIFICREDQVEGGKNGNGSTSFFDGSIEFRHPSLGMEPVIEKMQVSDKIIIHGFWRDKINDILVSNPEFYKKSYWVMYGGDYYEKKTCSQNHKTVAKNIGYLINGITPDISLVRENYGSVGKHIESFFYTTNVCNTNFVSKADNSNLTILLGHSGIADNQHIKYCLAFYLNLIL